MVTCGTVTFLISFVVDGVSLAFGDVTNPIAIIINFRIVKQLLSEK
jgi:hypothetical protein